MSILKVNTIQDKGGNAIISSDGSGTVTVNNDGLKNAPVFEAYLGSNQTVTGSTWTKISLNNTTINTGSGFDTSTYKFTCSEAGNYFFIGNLRGTSSSSYQFAVNTPAVWKNGVLARQSYNHMNSSNAPSNVESKTVHTVLNLAVNDYVEFYAYIATYAGTPTINSEDTYLQGFKLIGA